MCSYSNILPFFVQMKLYSHVKFKVYSTIQICNRNSNYHNNPKIQIIFTQIKNNIMLSIHANPQYR